MSQCKYPLSLGGGEEGGVACTWSLDDRGLSGNKGLIVDDIGLRGYDIGLTGECSFWLVCNLLSSVLPLPPHLSSVLRSFSFFISSSLSCSTVDQKIKKKATIDAHILLHKNTILKTTKHIAPLIGQLLSSDS